MFRRDGATANFHSAEVNDNKLNFGVLPRSLNLIACLDKLQPEFIIYFAPRNWNWIPARKFSLQHWPMISSIANAVNAKPIKNLQAWRGSVN